MSRKSLVVCPGSGQASGIVFSTSNPKVTCGYCSKRVEVTSKGRVRNHKAYRQVKG